MSMNLNRQQKRQMQKMGAVNENGAPVRTAPSPRPAPAERERTGLMQFLREVRAELRKVAWPTRNEVRSYSIIVLITVVLLTTFVALADWAFGSFSLWLFGR